MATIVEFPFNSGAYEAADREWLPANFLAVVENMRLDLDGRLGVRPGFTALASSAYTAIGQTTMTAYDLVNYNGRLMALGDQNGLGRPTGLFEFVNAPPAAWRSASPDIANIPRATQARELGKVPDSATDVRYVSTAAVSVSGRTYVLAVHQLQSENIRMHVFLADTDQSLVVVSRPLRWARAITVGSTLWVIGQQTNNNNIVGHSFAPGTDQNPTGPVVLISPGAIVRDIAAAQTGASDFTVAYIPNGGGSVEAVRFNSAGTAQSTFTAQGGLVQAVACAVCGNSAGTLLSFAYETQSGATGSYFLKTTSQTGAGGVGPTALFGGATVTGFVRLGMAQSGTQISICGLMDNGSTVDVATQLCTGQSTNTLASTIRYANAFLRAAPAPIVSGGQTNFYYGCVDNLAAADGQATNMLVEQALRMPMCFKDAQLAGPHTGTENYIGSSALVGTKLYWGNTIQSVVPRDPDSVINSGASGTTTELEMNDTGRRQMAQVSNQLHISGACPMVYDGRALFEQGFAERPSIRLAQSAGGSLTALGRYFVAATWEVVDGRGNILRSAASDPASITLTAGNQTISATVPTPHSLRVWPFNIVSAGCSVRVAIYRTIANGANFFLDQFITVNAAQFGDLTTGFIATTDASVSDNAVLYTQSQTPVPHVSPPPYKYTWPARERQFIGGLPLGETWTYSKLLFPSEPVEFAPLGRLGFSGRANQDITAVGAFETVGVVFTKAEIAQISGRGPEQNGTGDFDPFTLIPAPGGCIDWRSLVSTPDGLFFQMLKEKLMILRRASTTDAGKVEWIGQGIQQTLALFPVITAACYVRSQSQIIVAFSVTNTAGDQGRVLIYDTKHDTWYVDTVGPVTALSELDGRLACLQAGAVSLQDVAPGSGTFPTCTVQSGFLPVTKRLGWGRIYKVGLLGAALGACTVEAFIDYDDGVGPVSLGTATFTGTEGQFERFWSLNVQKVSRFSVKFVVTSASSNTLGLRLNAWAVEVDGSPNMVRVGSTGQVA